MDQNMHHYEQKIEYARAGLWAPFYAVGMVARIRGFVPIDVVKTALVKIRTMFPPLASRVRIEKDGSAWLTTENVAEFTLETRQKFGESDWIALFLEQERIPFAFKLGPVARFFLLQGSHYSDLISIVPHVVCDGYSMTFAMWELVSLLNHPTKEVTTPVQIPSVSWKTMHHALTDNIFQRGLVRVLNLTWPDKRIILQQEDYESILKYFWASQKNSMLQFSLSQQDTANLGKRCKQHGISITGALLSAFHLAQSEIADHNGNLSKQEISVSVNIRDRLIQSPGQAVGVYASSIDIRLPTKKSSTFWQVACEAHANIHRGLKNRSHIQMPLVLEELDPSIADGLVVALSTNNWGNAYSLLTHFVKIKNDSHSLNISNIGRVDLPDAGSEYPLATMFPLPPSFPGSGLTLNVLTVNNLMNLILKFNQENPGEAAAEKIKDRALEYLTCA